jgi:diaminohydroxyphosphoribosylaminopyrimidine deaminase/5-amino-6-(5-phosphoribosylamino)uracil reductase
MIEGGAAVNGSALSSGIVDKIFFYYAPKIFAAEEAVPLRQGGFRHLDEAPRR